MDVKEDAMRVLHIREFDPRSIERNTREAIYLEVTSTPGGMPIRQTVLVIGGAEPGPVLLVSGGVHGDEYEGPLAITRLFHELEPADIKGTFVGLVVANVPAFEAATRCSPIDGLNLARVFPGRVDGSVTQQIAYWMGERLIGRADYYIDLHSSGSDMEMVQLAGYTLGDGPVAETRRRMAEAFRAQVTWAHTDQSTGRTLSYAIEHDIPAIYTECPASRRVSIPDMEAYQRGVRNVLRELGMLEGALEGSPSPYYFRGVGNTDTALPVSQSGYFIPRAELLEWVEQGDLLGAVYDLAGNVLEEVRAPTAGYVGLRQLLPTINAGDTVFMLAERFESK
jgi:predicted deacylase